MSRTNVLSAIWYQKGLRLSNSFSGSACIIHESRRDPHTVQHTGIASAIALGVFYLRPKNSPGGASGCRARASGCWHATRAKKTIGHQTSLLQSLRLNTIVMVVILFKVVTVMSVMTVLFPQAKQKHICRA